SRGYLHRRELRADLTLQATGRRPHRTKLERTRQREQHPRAAGGIIGRAIGERRGSADVDLQAVGEEEANATAGRGQRKAIAEPIAVIPGHAAVDEAVELVAAQI